MADIGAASSDTDMNGLPKKVERELWREREGAVYVYVYFECICLYVCEYVCVFSCGTTHDVHFVM